MPRISKSSEKNHDIREKILDTAINLITTMGYNNTSMRKIALDLGMSATNIYNYFSSKDSLYLEIQTKGFDILFKKLIISCNTIEYPREKIICIIKEYLTFGIENPNWYNIIFSMDTPKYADYRNKKIEPVAYMEKQAGLKVIDFTTDVIKELLRLKKLPIEKARFKTIQLWTQLHGIVSLYNSRVLQEVDEDTDTIINMLADDFISGI